MKITKRRRHAAAVLWLRLEEWTAAAVILALLLGFGWWIATARTETPIEYCIERYAGARTRQDSAAADYSRQTSGSRTCGDLRRDGMLNRHPPG